MEKIKKIKKIKKLILLFSLYLGFLATYPIAVFANQDHLEDIVGTAIILVERNTGRVLFGRNEDTPIYPASMIKVLTAIVMLDYIQLNDIVRVTGEIYHTPFGSSLAGHFYGENISGLNLLRGLILPSGNDTANVVVANVARRHTGTTMPFPQAEQVFAELMNEKARQIGATNSNFTNAHGFHDPEMKSTARDLALIADYALNIPIIRQVATERHFSGPSMENPAPNQPIREISWSNTNRLLVGQYYHPYATGLKTGFHTPAGWCFIGTATRGDMEVITVIAGSYASQRWFDTAALFDYAFENYEMRLVHSGREVVYEIDIYNPRWGDETTAQAIGTNSFSYFLSITELNSIQKDIVFLTDLAYENEEGLAFIAPLYAGDIIGSVVFTLNGTELFRDNIILTRDIYPWSYASSIQFVFDYLLENPFSVFGLSFVLALIFLFIVIYKIVAVILRFRARRASNWYS
ncbi:MAG: D-alanyl-D-alanine carboxypeptidase [Defluviitaleaceae bacterium]|nr:D-alanyl-D-alanine carboxypeptidase [Defluviitaleaceae bacterium]